MQKAATPRVESQRRRPASLSSDLKQNALEIGFDLVGLAPLAAWQDLEFSRAWVEKGYGGEMRYLANPKRYDPRLVLPAAKSVVCVGLIYNAPLPYSTEVSCQVPVVGCQSTAAGAEDNGPRTTGDGPRAWISRYAWGHDYHELMRGKLERLREAIERLAPGVETRVYVDTGPIVERAFARLSGIGWMGKNTCLINQGKGSWFFLGVLLTSLELAPDLPAFDRCGSCMRCLEACPTGALVEPYVMDASRCIAYFNIELKGSIPVQSRSAIGANLFGCDICQDVCPWNRRQSSVVSGRLQENDQPSAASSQQTSRGRFRRTAALTTLPEFQPMKVRIKHDPVPQQTTNDGLPSPSPPDFFLFNPSIQALSSLTEDDFHRVFAHSPIKRRKYRGWLRNLCVVMGNSGDPRFLSWLEKARDHEDPIVREHADWAIARLKNRAP